jgi:hypothetical protein
MIPPSHYNPQQQSFISAMLGNTNPGLFGGLGQSKAQQQQQSQQAPNLAWEGLGYDMFMRQTASPILSFFDKLRNEIDEWLKI